MSDHQCTETDRLTSLQVKQAEIQGQVNAVADSVAYVRKRIDNGISTRIESTHDIVLKLEPIIAHHAKVVHNIEMMGWWLSRGVLAAVIGVVFWAVSKGYAAKF